MGEDRHRCFCSTLLHLFPASPPECKHARLCVLRFAGQQLGPQLFGANPCGELTRIMAKPMLSCIALGVHCWAIANSSMRKLELDFLDTQSWQWPRNCCCCGPGQCLKQSGLDCLHREGHAIMNDASKALTDNRSDPCCLSPFRRSSKLASNSGTRCFTSSDLAL